MRGDVQGVGYRWFTRDAAEENGVSGWVRNRHDGSVEAVLHGDADAVERVLAALHTGPRHARVDAVESLPADTAPSGAFEIRPTL